MLCTILHLSCLTFMQLAEPTGPGSACAEQCAEEGKQGSEQEAMETDNVSTNILCHK